MVIKMSRLKKKSALNEVEVSESVSVERSKSVSYGLKH